MKRENIAYEKAYQFAIRIVKAYQHLTQEKREFVLSKHLELTNNDQLIIGH